MIQITANFSVKIIEARGQWNNIIKMLKGIVMLEFLSNEGKMKTFSNEGEPSESTAKRSALKEMLKEVLQTKGK